jgi:hypothetical protein
VGSFVNLTGSVPASAEQQFEIPIPIFKKPSRLEKGAYWHSSFKLTQGSHWAH